MTVYCRIKVPGAFGFYVDLDLSGIPRVGEVVYVGWLPLFVHQVYWRDMNHDSEAVSGDVNVHLGYSRAGVADPGVSDMRAHWNDDMSALFGAKYDDNRLFDNKSAAGEEARG